VAVSAGISGNVILKWDYPPDEIENVTFNIRYSTNLDIPLTDWVILANVATTNVILEINTEIIFFYVTATNSNGESEPF